MFSSVLLFFEFGPGEIMLIMLVTLILFGGDKLPELARGLGKGIRDFKAASEGVKREITNQIDNFETKKNEIIDPKTKQDESPVAKDESLVIADEKPRFEPPANAVPIADTPPVAEAEQVTEPVHLKETPIQAPEKTHEEIKS